jgi:hypothetical protein
MANGMYEVLALIPYESDFTLDGAVRYFASKTFSRFRAGRCIFKNEPVRAELATSEGKGTSSGFRVFYGEWSIVSWLEDRPHVLVESCEMAEDENLPGPADVIRGCSRRLSVWSDEDRGGDHSDDFIKFTDQLREQFGAFIKDCVNGGWWT